MGLLSTTRAGARESESGPGRLALDRAMMEHVLTVSSSGVAREAASAWLAAFDTALACGAREDEAHARACDALEAAQHRARRLGGLALRTAA